MVGEKQLLNILSNGPIIMCDLSKILYFLTGRESAVEQANRSLDLFISDCRAKHTDAMFWRHVFLLVR